MAVSTKQGYSNPREGICINSLVTKVRVLDKVVWVFFYLIPAVFTATFYVINVPFMRFWGNMQHFRILMAASAISTGCWILFWSPAFSALLASWSVSRKTKLWLYLVRRGYDIVSPAIFMIAFNILRKTEEFASAQTAENPKLLPDDEGRAETSLCIDQMSIPDPANHNARSDPTDPMISSDSNDVTIASDPNDIILVSDPNDITVTSDPNDIIVAPDPNDTIVASDPNDVTVTSDPNVVNIASDPNNIIVASDSNDVTVTSDPNGVTIASDPNDIIVASDPNDATIASNVNDFITASDPDDVIEVVPPVTMIIEECSDYHSDSDREELDSLIAGMEADKRAQTDSNPIGSFDGTNSTSSAEMDEGKETGNVVFDGEANSKEISKETDETENNGIGQDDAKTLELESKSAECTAENELEPKSKIQELEPAAIRVTGLERDETSSREKVGQMLSQNHSELDDELSAESSNPPVEQVNLSDQLHESLVQTTSEDPKNETKLENQEAVGLKSVTNVSENSYDQNDEINPRENATSNEKSIAYSNSVENEATSTDGSNKKQKDITSVNTEEIVKNLLDLMKSGQESGSKMNVELPPIVSEALQQMKNGNNQQMIDLMKKEVRFVDENGVERSSSSKKETKEMVEKILELMKPSKKIERQEVSLPPIVKERLMQLENSKKDNK